MASDEWQVGSPRGEAEPSLGSGGQGSRNGLNAEELRALRETKTGGGEIVKRDMNQDSMD